MTISTRAFALYRCRRMVGGWWLSSFAERYSTESIVQNDKKKQQKEYIARIGDVDLTYIQDVAGTAVPLST